MLKSESVKAKISHFLNQGYCIGESNVQQILFNIYKVSSACGGRRLRELMESDPMSYVYIDIKSHNGGKYRMFFDAIKRRIKVKKVGDGFCLYLATGVNTYLRTEVYNTRAEAVKQVKQVSRR